MRDPNSWWVFLKENPMKKIDNWRYHPPALLRTVVPLLFMASTLMGFDGDHLADDLLTCSNFPPFFSSNFVGSYHQRRKLR
jgi:hypothetical protein